MDKDVKANKINDVLTALGVTENTLTGEEKKSLDEIGFVIFRDFIEEDWLEALRDKFEELVEIEKDGNHFVFGKESGVRRVSDLINKGEVFDRVWTHPKILASAYHVIQRDFKVNSINSRDAMPGEGHQDLHPDWGSRKKDEPYSGINTLWLLDDFLLNNGATRLVPGTHLLPGTIKDYVDNPSAPHPDEIIPELKAGDVIVYNWHLWHGGTQNKTNLKRRVLHPSFIAREFPQQYNQREFLLQSTYDRLTPAARYLLDVDGSL